MNKLMWFRQDLRLMDNQALTAAIEAAKIGDSQVRALFIASPEQWQQHSVAPIQIDFIERHLQLLAQELMEAGIDFELIHVDLYQDIAATLTQYCIENNIDAVYASEDPEWNEIQRDRDVQSALNSISCDLILTSQHCILPPGSVKNQSGAMYKVFTPFRQRWCQHARQRQWALVDKPVAIPTPPSASQKSSLQLLAPKTSSAAWQAGEQVAQQCLKAFVSQQVGQYKEARDFPAVAGTSQLSPYLAIGVLSPKQCLVALLSEFPDVLVDESSDGRTWLNELIWRDFYRHLLVAFPRLSKGQNFKHNADRIIWSNRQQDFQAWCEGRTGYPIVDAAMRQLNQTGWMHNRLRMIVASFLCKHLLIDWRWGETYFKTKLIDGDLAANNGGWQWSAGTGCDAQPYFRVFNPVTQAQKFDPQGDFIRKFVPELAHVSGRALFQPQPMVRKDLLTGDAYPAAIVEHKQARVRALDVLSVIKAN